MEQQATIERDPYGRLLHRLALALSEADSLAQLSDQPPSDLEVRGLSAAELALIQAYLANDHNGLSIWHAAAAHPTQPAPILSCVPPFTRKPLLACEPCAGVSVTQRNDRHALSEL